MEASTYAWAVILTFFLLYGTIQLRKGCIQLLSSGEVRSTSTNRLSRSSVYTIENDSGVRSFCNDRNVLSSDEKKDGLPSYEEVMASDTINPINNVSTSSEICSTSNESIGIRETNVTTSNTTVDR